MTKLIDIDAIFDNVEINEADVIEATRRSKISETSRFKMATDPEFQQIKREGAKKSADIKRKIPLEDYESIIREYWDPNVKRKHGFIGVIAERYSLKQGYGSKLTGQVEKIILNWYNTLPDDEYAVMRTAWEQTNPDFRTDMLKDLYKSGKRKTNGFLISSALDSVDAVTAQKIYAECLTQEDSRTQKNYQRLAKQYKVPAWQKVRDIANGHHYSLTDVNAAEDIEQWRLNIGEGNYEMTDTDGNSYMFNDLKQFGYFLNQHWGKDTSDETKNWYTGRAWFEKCTANTWYTKQRREFKGWKYCNHLPAKYK
jgi:hypothetical protein